MPDVWWHIIECGSVGDGGPASSPGKWTKYSTGIVAYKAADDWIDHQAKPVVRKIAKMIGRLTNMEVHDMVELPGGYCGVGIGDVEGPIDIPPLHSYDDLFLTVIFNAPDSTPEEVAATMAKITIARAKLYLKVYERTDGLIKLSYGHRD